MTLKVILPKISIKKKKIKTNILVRNVLLEIIV